MKTQDVKDASGRSALSVGLGQHIGWAVFTENDDLTSPALYTLSEEEKMKEAAMRWNASVMAIYTHSDAPHI